MGEGHALDLAVMAGQTMKAGASRGVPEPDGLVAAGGGNDATVGADVQAVDVRGMTGDRDRRVVVATTCVPDPNCAVETARQQRATIW